MHFVSAIRKNSKLAIIVVVILLIIIGPTIFFNILSNNNVIYNVHRENLINNILVNGTFTTASQTQVYSPTDGNITKLYVQNGNMVKKGDPLFHVESSASADQEKAAYATYLAASSTLQSDTADLYSLQSTMYSKWKTYTDIATNSTYQNSNGSPNTTNRVLPEFTTSQDDWLAAEANYKNQQAVIAKDNAALASAKQAYDQTQNVTVTAPTTGKVINLAAQVNDQVSVPLPASATQTTPADSTQTPNSPVLIIADFSNPIIVSSVDQANIPHLAAGQKAYIVFDALPNQTYSGTIKNIDEAGIKTQGTTDFNVYITLSHVPSTVRPNMTASITIETARRNNVLTIPNDAIITKNRKDYVQLAGNDKNNLTEVTLGLKGLTKTEVTSGLSAGDNVIEQQ